jgi:RNA polymerase sigma factor (TIGR02999 family)
VTSDRDLTGLLQAWSKGDRDALAVLATVVHQDLRVIARRLLADECRDGRWRPTELVQESYLRLLDWRGVHWQNRAHFFATAARMMRRILVDAARARRAIKRGEGIDAMPLDGVDVAASTRPADMVALEDAVPLEGGGVAAPTPPADMVALEDALEALEIVNPRASHIVELRFFGGFSVEETAETLGISVRTVINDWNTARGWLYQRLSTQGRR